MWLQITTTLTQSDLAPKRLAKIRWRLTWWLLALSGRIRRLACRLVPLSGPDAASFERRQRRAWARTARFVVEQRRYFEFWEQERRKGKQ